MAELEHLEALSAGCIGTAESGQGFKLPNVGLHLRFEATDGCSLLSGYCDVGSGNAAAGLQTKGDYFQDNNSTAFQCPTHRETSAGKSSPSWAAP